MRPDDIPAFPQSVRKIEKYMDEGGFGHTRLITAQEGGLTLRDYFAAKAMQGIFADHAWADYDHERIAMEAYRAADAMLKAREQ